MKISIVCVLSCIFALVLVSPINGSCKRDIGNELDYNNTHINLRDTQRLYTYPPSSARVASSSSTLKFMTFNMQSGFLTDCVSNVSAQTSFIQSETVDYIASEEVDVGVSSRCNCNIPQLIANAAGVTSVFGMTLPYGTGLYGTNTGTTQAILETRNQLLVYSGVEQRMVVAVRTQPEALKGRNLWFATVHVEFYNNDARYSQINQTVEFLNALMAEDPMAVVVIGGDFNGGPWDQGYTEVKDGGFHNAWETFNNGSIDNGNTIPAESPGSRFDHIWFKAPSDVNITVPLAVVPDVLLSDHRPFWAMLSFVVNAPTQAPIAATRAPIAPTRPAIAPTRAATRAPTPAPIAAIHTPSSGATVTATTQLAVLMNALALSILVIRNCLL